MQTSDGLLLSLQAQGEGGFFSTALMMVAFVAIFYFVMWRPRQQEEKEQAALLASLQKGDKVVTTGGLHARIVEVRPTTLLLEIAPNVVIVVERETVRRKGEPKADAPKDGKADAPKSDAKGA